jgi:hypothetical protein
MVAPLLPSSPAPAAISTLSKGTENKTDVNLQKPNGHTKAAAFNMRLQAVYQSCLHWQGMLS